MIEEKAEDIAQGPVIIFNPDATPLQVHLKVFHVPVNLPVGFVACVIFSPALRGRGHITNADND